MPDISSNMGAGLDPLLQTTYTAEVEVARAPGSDNTWITGSLGSMNGTGKSGIYSNLASHPSLVDIQDPNNINTQGSNWSLADSPNTQPDKQTQAFNSSLVTELLTQHENGEMTLTQTSQVRYYLLHPQEKPPSTIKELVDKTLASVTSRFIQENNLSSDWKPNQEYDQELYDRDAGSAWDSAFEAAIKDKPNAAQLRFEHYNRASGSPLTAEEKAALKTIQDDYGMPDTYIPEADKKGFTEQVNIDYSANFLASLKNQSPPLSESDQAKLEYAFNHPEDQEIAAFLKKILAKLMGQAVAETSKQSGIPDGAEFDFKVNSRPYDAKLNGFFQEFQNNRYEAFVAEKTAIAPWTEDNPILLKQYLEGTTTNVPDFVKAAAASIRQQAIGDVQGHFNLQGIAWSPVAPGTFPLVNFISQSILDQSDAFLKIAQTNIEGMPAGPAKETYINILKRIGQAISELKEAIYETMGGDTTKMREVSKAKLEIALASIKEQMDGAKEVAKQQKKAGDLGKGVNICSAITSFFSIIASIGGGPVAIAFAIVSFIDTVDPNSKNLQKMMDGINSAVGGLMDALGVDKATKTGFQKTVQMALLVVLITYGGGAVVASQQGTKLLEMSGVIKEISVAAGASIEEADKANKYFAMALGLSVAVGSMAAGFSGAGGMVTGLSSNMNLLMKISSCAQMGINFFTQAVSQGMSIKSALILSDVALLKGKLASEKTLNDAEIQELMKLIKKLLALISGSAEFVAELTDTQKNVLGNAIQSIAGLGSRG